MCNAKLPLSLLLLLLLAIVVVCSASPGYNDNINYWEAFAPGKLLQRLDTLTNVSTASADRKLDDEQENHSGNVSAAAESADEDDDQLEPAKQQADEADDADNYEHNYEQFVRQYFDRVHNGDDDTAEDLADASLQSGSVELDEPAPVASNVETKSRLKANQPSEQRCKRVQRKQQLCKICKNARNNEVSETCSYSHAEQPAQYAYDTGSAYRRYREADAEPRHDTAAADGSLCVRRQRKQHVCYDCEDSAGQRLQRCYKLQATDGPPEQSHKAEQRIYKRTISYSYSGRKNATTGDVGGAATTVLPPPPLLQQQKPRRLLKVRHTRRRRGNALF